MATFRKRNSRWQVEVCVRGSRCSGTFATKKEAQAWAARQELDLREGLTALPNRPFSDLMDRYSREVSTGKRGGTREQKMIAVILRDPIADVSLRELAARHFSDWRDRRLQQVSGATVDREMNILSHACSVARREWGWLRTNPLSDVRRPPPTAARTRRPTSDEIERLSIALGYAVDREPSTKSARVGAAFLFAIETAMRAGEICALTWDNVHENHVHLPMTKNGYSRDVPLTAEANRIIKQLKSVTETKPTVFDVSARSVDALFRKAKKQVLIEDLHFHDSRREALTKLAEIFDVMELARISGHRDLRILQNVYYAPKVSDLASKLV